MLTLITHLKSIRPLRDMMTYTAIFKLDYLIFKYGGARPGMRLKVLVSGWLEGSS